MGNCCMQKIRGRGRIQKFPQGQQIHNRKCSDSKNLTII